MKPVIHAPYINRRSFLRRLGPAALGTTVVANTIRDLRIMNAALAQQAPLSDYKALICVFLNGGNDSNNMIIPSTASEYANYATVRTPALALPNIDSGVAPALPLLKSGGGNYVDKDNHTYAFHPAMVGLQSLFNSGYVAPVLNVGNLSYPLTKAQYTAGKVPKPPQLFSHSDQQTQWQTSLPDQPYTSGWGGRIGDLMSSTPTGDVNANGKLSMAVSVAGSNIFEVGNVNAAPQYSITTGGAVSLSSVTSGRLTALQSILNTDIASSNLQTSAYSGVLSHAISEASTLTTALAGNASASWLTGRFPSTVTTPNLGSTFTSSLMSQMKMVARLIDLGSTSVGAGGLGMSRQIFFIQVGGYDTHTGQTNNAGQTTTNNPAVVIGAQANLLAELSTTLNELFLALTAMGSRGSTPTPMQNQVTAFTVSDFARTFPSNGSGSDHGWGGHQLVVGGAVKGGATYGTFPTLQVNGPSDTGIGRWIPTTSVDQYAATLASWFGVSSGNMSTILPNLGRFASSNLGFI